MTEQDKNEAAAKSATESQQTTTAASSEQVAATTGSTQDTAAKGTFDLQDILAKINDTVTKTVQSAVGPLQSKVTVQEEMARTGFNREQYEAWSKIKAMGLSDEEALDIAFQRSPDTFPELKAEAEKNQRSAADLPPGGLGPSRTRGQEQNYEEIMRQVAADPKKSLYDLQVAAKGSLFQKLTRW